MGGNAGFVPKRDRRGATAAWDRPEWLRNGVKLRRKGDTFGFVYRINAVSTAETPVDSRVLLRDCETGEEDWVTYPEVAQHYEEIQG